jgi:hypothetical protein
MVNYTGPKGFLAYSPGGLNSKGFYFRLFNSVFIETSILERGLVLIEQSLFRSPKVVCYLLCDGDCYRRTRMR